MGFVGDLIGDVVGGITGANQAADASQAAAQTQAAASTEAIGEQRRQFDSMVELMSPFITGGQQSLAAQQAILGLGGEEAQQQLVQGIESSPLFQNTLQQGENAILQNASATGGLRGGNTQAALAQFRPQLLNSLVDQQFNRLGGLTQLGQAASAGQASAGMQTGQNIGNLLQQQGAAIAGGQVAAGQAPRQAFGDLLGIGGTIFGGF